MTHPGDKPAAWDPEGYVLWNWGEPWLPPVKSELATRYGMDASHRVEVEPGADRDVGRLVRGAAQSRQRAHAPRQSAFVGRPPTSGQQWEPEDS